MDSYGGGLVLDWYRGDGVGHWYGGCDFVYLGVAVYSGGCLLLKVLLTSIRRIITCDRNEFLS